MAFTSVEDYILRPATFDDASELKPLRTASVTHFCAGHYSTSAISAILASARDGRYDDLISKGTYFVLTTPDSPARIVASAGWTPHRTVYSDKPGESATIAVHEPFDPSTDAAWIRGMYVHPDYARRGLAARLVKECETDARRAGFVRVHLSATTNAVQLYESCGYVKMKEGDGVEMVGLPNGEMMASVMMKKNIEER
ncbi:hypothetical protein H2200_009677 [Cladophialophora chaetospira]|uniref:N-acetyltransferase domain-containing protein n=1 Tax=Cladophialophora chaetospira TaxID=386627 RepID=A0AA39CEY7_9EURO|nr:hypothetical protein H2200_009677 [Cladophialophora chaetospira]